MIIGVTYPFPPYGLDREERVFTVQGRPHPYFALNACKGLVDKHYVLTSRPDVEEVARECGCIIVPWELVDKAKGVMPGHQMNNAVIDFIKEDLDEDYVAIGKHTWLHMNLANALVRQETLKSMIDAVECQERPNVYLAVQVRQALGVVDEDGSMFSVLNNAPLEFEGQDMPTIVWFENETCVTCNRFDVPGQRKHFAHQVSDLEGLRVDNEMKAQLATYILDELPDYYQKS